MLPCRPVSPAGHSTPQPHLDVVFWWLGCLSPFRIADGEVKKWGPCILEWVRGRKRAPKRVSEFLVFLIDFLALGGVDRLGTSSASAASVTWWVLVCLGSLGFL